MVALVALGLVLVDVLGRGSPKVSKTQAIAIARPRIDFAPGGTRFGSSAAAFHRAGTGSSRSSSEARVATTSA